MKSIVVYYSRPDENYGVGEVEVGNTELLAKEIIKQTGADKFKIEPKVPYPKNYMDCVNQATEELKKQCSPRISWRCRFEGLRYNLSRLSYLVG